MARALACCVVVLAGCYEPQLTDCAVRCADAAECAPGQVCRADGWCTAPENTGACAPMSAQGELVPVSGWVVDAALDASSPSPDAPKPPPPDAASVDAPLPPTCAPGCSGVCENGVCVIACVGEKACEQGVTCPAQGPCEVLCVGEKACSGGVECGSGRCTVTCNGEKACQQGVECEDACACEVTCSGDKACMDDAECPAPACEAGRGCHANGACDQC